MAKIIDNFDYQGKKPNFTRDRFETLAEMHNYNSAWLSDGLITFCVEDRNHYKWDDAIGEWVLLQTGGFGYEYIYCKTRTLSAPSVPTAQSNEDGYVPAGWSASPMSVSLNYPYCWMAYRQKSGGAWSAWKGSSENITLAALWAKYGADGATGATGPQGPKGDRGYQGNTGKDGRGIKSQTYTYQISASDKEIPASGASVVGGVLRTSGSVENGVLSLNGKINDGVLSISDGDWLDKSPATTSEKPYLWRRTITVYTDGTSEATYALIGVKGDKGTDGLSVEYVFRSTYYNNAPSISGTSQEDDFVPTGWSDEPMNVSESAPYVWVSQRKKVDNVWGAFSAPTLWARFSKDGVNGKDGADGKDGENGLSVEDIIEWYYLSTSATERMGGKETTTRPQWQNGKYLWTRTQFNYSDGETTQYTDWRCVTGAAGDKGKTGKILRMRGVWSSKDSYVNNDEFQDVVIYSGNYYTPKIAKAESTHHPTNENYWEPFNEFQNVATSVLLAYQGYIDVLGSGRIFIGQTEDGDGWEITQGAIRHTRTGLTLTDVGKLLVPEGCLNVEIGDDTHDLIDITVGEITKNKEIIQGIQTDVSNNRGEITALQQTASNITTRVENAEGNISILEQTAKNLSLKVESRKSRNLLKDSGFFATLQTEFANEEEVWGGYAGGNATLPRVHKGGFYDYRTYDVPNNVANNYAGIKYITKDTLGMHNGDVFTVSFFGRTMMEGGNFTLAIRFLDSAKEQLSIVQQHYIPEVDDDWKKYKLTATMPDENVSHICLDFFCKGVNDFSISLPQMEYGESATEWSPNEADIETKLLATGIDIEQNKVTITADTFKVQDNSGKEMAVFENVGQSDGSTIPMLKTDLVRVKKIEGASGYFSGFVLNVPIYVTEENMAEYFDVNTVGNLSTISMRKESLSKYIIFQGEFKNVTAVSISLPSILPSQSKFSADELLMARGLIGETITIVNYDATNSLGNPLQINVNYVTETSQGGTYITERGAMVRATCRTGVVANSLAAFNYREIVYWSVAEGTIRLATETGYGKIESEF